MTALLFVLSLLGTSHAEEKTCLIQGMECQNCVDMITKDVCREAYGTCQVSLKDKKNHLGQVHVITKDPAGKVDLKSIEAAAAKLNYTVASCADGAPKPSAKR